MSSQALAVHEAPSEYKITFGKVSDLRSDDRTLIHLLSKRPCQSIRGLARFLRRNPKYVVRHLRILRDLGYISWTTKARRRITYVVNVQKVAVPLGGTEKSGTPLTILSKSIINLSFAGSQTVASERGLAEVEPDDIGSDFDRTDTSRSEAKEVLETFKASLNRRNCLFNASVADKAQSRRLIKIYGQKAVFGAMRQYFTGDDEPWARARVKPFLHFVGCIEGLMIQSSLNK